MREKEQAAICDPRAVVVDAEGNLVILLGGGGTFGRCLVERRS
jgi:PHP family Zn ribbon phosphoesterase